MEPTYAVARSRETGKLPGYVHPYSRRSSSPTGAGRGPRTIITRQALRRGNFPTVADLITAIERFIAAWNDRCQPFTWTKDPDTIIAKETNPRHRNTPTTSVTEH